MGDIFSNEFVFRSIYFHYFVFSIRIYLIMTVPGLMEAPSYLQIMNNFALWLMGMC